MNLHGDKRVPDPHRDKAKGKMPQTEEGSKAMETPKDIPLPRTSKDMTSINYNVLARLKRIPVIICVYGALILTKELREAFIHGLLNPET